MMTSTHRRHKNVFSTPIFDWCKKDKSTETQHILMEADHLQMAVNLQLLLEEIMIGVLTTASCLYISFSDTAASRKHFSKFDQASKITFIDCWSDPYGWNDDLSSSEEIWRDMNDLNGLLKKVEEWWLQGKERGFIILDDISSLNDYSPASCGILNGITSLIRGMEVNDNGYACHIISILNTDLLDIEEVRSIEYDSDVYIRVSEPEPQLIKTDTIIRRRSGKSIISEELYKRNHINDRIQNYTPGSVTSAPQKETKEFDPTANLTFNLKLTDEEKKAKENVVLPYRFHLNQKEEKSATKGSIIYIDEDDDAFNDEDDDLDI